MFFSRFAKLLIDIHLGPRNSLCCLSKLRKVPFKGISTLETMSFLQNAGNQITFTVNNISKPIASSSSTKYIPPKKKNKKKHMKDMAAEIHNLLAPNDYFCFWFPDPSALLSHGGRSGSKAREIGRWRVRSDVCGSYWPSSGGQKPKSFKSWENLYKRKMQKIWSFSPYNSYNFGEDIGISSSGESRWAWEF